MEVLVQLDFVADDLEPLAAGGTPERVSLLLAIRDEGEAHRCPMR
jgi:hypothetical protein